MGVAFPPSNPVAAISVAAISDRLQPERREVIAQQMHREVRKIVAVLAVAASSANEAADPGDRAR
jgi:DNA-binding IclR family transcriptional regulator